MSELIQFQSVVGEDGVLHLQVNLGESEAKKAVVVTIEAVELSSAEDTAALSWHAFVEQTYGSCAGLGLERPDQGAFEEREPLE